MNEEGIRSIKFLENNGFVVMGEHNHYANDRCSVVVTDDGYEIANNDGGTMYSNGLNMYWLIGVLTYYEYIDKNYIIY